MSGKQKAKYLGLDGLRGNANGDKATNLLSFRHVFKDNLFSSVFFSKNGITRDFVTNDSGLYYSCDSRREMRDGQLGGRLDGLYGRNLNRNKIYEIGKTDLVALRIRRKYAKFSNYVSDLFSGAVEGVTPARMWNLSIVGAVIFGMITMTMIYRYLGQNVSAKMEDSTKKTETVYQSSAMVAGAGDINDEIDVEYITRILENEGGTEKISKKEFEKEIRDMVKGYPIEKMVPEIVKKDRVVAAFLVAIAKKESNWGKRVPVLDGQDCLNYWGYRGIRDRMGTGGHTCFDSIEDAVNTVGERIEYLVSETKRNTPDKMVVWKCGYDCSWDSKTAVKKWISDVDLYFRKLNKD